MTAICSCCDVDLCEACGHHCECQHAQRPYVHHQSSGGELLHDLAC